MTGLARRLRGEWSAPGALVALVLVVLVGANVFGSRSVPWPIAVVGLVGGATVALQATGIVLVYRANRVINFAQLQMGAVAGAFFLELIDRRVFVRGIRAVCPPCVPIPKTVGDIASVSDRLPAGFAKLAANTSLRDPRVTAALPARLSRGELAIGTAPGWAVQLGFWLSVVVSIAVATALVGLLYVVIVKRFADAPRLVLTVVTIAAGSFAGLAGDRLLDLVFGASATGTPRFGQNWGIDVPIDFRFELGSAVFSAVDAVLVLTAVAVAVGLTLYFRRARAGIVLRGAAENPQRAETLGVNLDAVTARAWLMAGALSGAAAVLAAAKVGAPALNDAGALVRALAAAVSGGLVGLPLAVAGALAVGVVDQVVLRATGSQGWVSGLLLALIVVVLLAQRAASSRAEQDSAGAWLSSRELRPVPAVLRDLAPVRRVGRSLVVIGAAVVAGYPWFMSPSQTNLAAVTMTHAVIGLSLLILTGWAGQISLAQMAFAAIGAWVSAVSGLPFFFAVPLASVAGGLVAAAVGVPALRLRGLYLAVSTLALGLATSTILLDPRLLGRALPPDLARPSLLGIDFDDDRAFYYLTLGFLVAAVVATMGLRRSRTARALIAAKDNERAAQSFGISLVRARLVAFAISGCMAAVAGSLFAYSQRGVDIASFQPSVSVDLFLMTLLGGLGSIAGPILGAVYLGLLDLVAGGALGGIAEVLLSPGLGVLVVLITVPGGLSQVVYGIRDAWLRRLASRMRIDVPSLSPPQPEGGALPISPKVRSDGTPAFVPPRYSLEEQWGVEWLARSGKRA